MSSPVPPEVGRILVTGASGFIASYVIQQLLQSGHQVRGTVRSLQDEAKVQAVRALCPDAQHPIELVEANLCQTDCWATAVRGCTHVLHLASPVPDSEPSNEAEVILPAIQGVLEVLRACAKSNQVRRVVLTSSIFAVSGGLTGGRFTEADWADVAESYMNAYTKSKVLSERAAWEFVTGHWNTVMAKGQKLELVTINPGYVIGRPLVEGLHSHQRLTKDLLEPQLPFLLEAHLPLVDVQDVATAHIRAISAPQVAGKRIIVHARSMWMRDIAQICAEEFDPQGYNVPLTEGPNVIMKLLSVFQKDMRTLTCGLGQANEFDNSRMRTLLQIEPRDIRASIVATCYTMIELGYIKRTHKYKGSHPEDCWCKTLGQACPVQ